MSILTVACTGFKPAEKQESKSGLAGTYFRGSDFTRPTDEINYLDTVDKNWGREKGTGWSARWNGYIKGPFSGEVTFTADALDGVRLQVDGRVLADGLDFFDGRSGKIAMKKGERVPVVIEYVCASGKGKMHLYWQWPGQAQTIIPPSALSYDPSAVADTAREGWPETGAELPKINVPPAGPEHACVERHVIVYDEPGRYAGWPANGGFWMWGDEMAVAFTSAWFKDKPDWEDGHAQDNNRGNENIVARSLDGGLTWTYGPYPILADDAQLKPSPGGINFSHLDLAMKFDGDRFYYSYNRARTWEGPFRLVVKGLPDSVGELTTRTCYFANGTQDGFMFAGFKPKDAQDLSICARTADGGKTFDLVGWISPDYTKAPAYERWLVYSAVKLSGSQFIAAVRRKINRNFGLIRTLNWIDVYESKDSGRTWAFLSKVADTDMPNNPFNGNPPSIFRLKDGRLCVTYGFRGKPPVICARLSSDNGRAWGKPIILRSGARNWDIGYTRTLQRNDGKVVTIYYFATPEHRNQYIEATIWDPAQITP